jgi:ATP-dependent helicase/nuclease subunit B
MQLLERVRQCSQPTEIVIAPVELHQRNIERRLREANKPKGSFLFDDAVGVSRSILSASGEPTVAIDRIDRLALVQGLLDDSISSSPTVSIPVGISSRDPQHIEQIRTEVETITNFHPDRISAWEKTAAGLYDPIDEDTEEVLDTALDVERGLRTQTEKAISETELIRRASREITTTDGATWRSRFPHIERLSLVGLSSISAVHADFIHALVTMTSLDVHVHFREATGDYLKGRFPSLLGISKPGVEVFQ